MKPLDSVLYLIGAWTPRQKRFPAGFERLGAGSMQTLPTTQSAQFHFEKHLPNAAKSLKGKD
jgi:hypothetical protein